MIRKTLLLSLFLLLLYIGLTRIFSPSSRVSQHQWQDNAIKAQDYIYDTNSKFKNVIIGSSLSCRFFMDSLEGYKNLAFNGLGIFDGLNVLVHKTNLPENVFIEMNVVLREENKVFTSSLFNPLLYEVKKDVPALRDGNQPIARAGVPISSYIEQLVSALKSHLVFKKVQKEIQVEAPKKVRITQKVVENNSLFLKLLKLQEAGYLIKPDSITLGNALNLLDKYVQQLIKRNVNICFFEMPVDSALCELPLAVAIRKAFNKKFPPDKFRYIPIPDCSEYQTSDGIHLVDQDALRYTIYFRNEAQNNIKG